MLIKNKDKFPAEKDLDIYPIELGTIGQSGDAKIERINDEVARLVLDLQTLLDRGQIKPLDYVKIGNVGVGEILEALDAFKTHKSGKKLIVQVAEA